VYTVVLMTSLATAAPAPTSCDGACTVAAADVWGSDLPAEVEVKGTSVYLDGARLTGTDAERDAVLMAVLSQADGNADRVDRLYRRQLGALVMASGGLGLEIGGAVVAVVVAAGAAPMTMGASLALPMGLAGAGIGLTGCGIGLSQRPVRKVVEHYNDWAAQNPEALVVGVPAA